MKKLALMMTLTIAAMLFTSCKKVDYKSFVGTWGVEKIEYYNIDYAGNPIASSMESHSFDANDPDNSIQLVFKEDKTGEMRDSARDTLWIENEEGEYVDYIYCPDTVLVYPFVFSYDNSDHALYMNIDYGEYMRTFRMVIYDMANNSFTYENEYDKDFIERAYLKRISKTATKSPSRQAVTRPHKPGSLLGGR